MCNSSSSLTGEEAIMELLDFVWRKYERTDSDAFVKVKCLRLLKHLCESGHERIRELIRRKYIQKIKAAQAYRGPPHPLQGDAPSARVREEATACLRALYAHEGEDAAAVAAAVEATRSRIEGFGSEDCWSFLPHSSGRAAAGLQQRQQSHAGKGDRSGSSFYNPSASVSYVNSNISSRNSSDSYSAATLWGAAAGGGMRPAMPGFGNPVFARQNAAAAATPGEQALYLISSTASKIIPAGMQQQLQRVVNAALPVAGLQSHPTLPRSGQRGSYGTSGSRGSWQNERNNPGYLNDGAGGFYRAPPRPGASSSSSTPPPSSNGSIRTHAGDVYRGLNWQSDNDRSKTFNGAGSSLSPGNGMNRPVSQGLPAGQYEERVVSAFLVPCGATLLPSRAVLRDFCCRCQSFDALVLGAVLVEKLSDASLSTASRLRLLAGSEALLKQEEMLQQQQQEVEGERTAAAAVTLKTYLLEHAKQQLLECLDTPQLRKVAAQVLLLIGESSAAAAAAEDEQQRRARGKPREGEVASAAGGMQSAKHTAAEVNDSGVTTADTPNLLDIAAGVEDTTPQQYRDLLDIDAAVAIPTVSGSEALLLLIGDSSSGDGSSNKNSNFSSSITDGSLPATALSATAPSAHTTASFNSLPHADEVNIVLANELQQHTPFSSLPSLSPLKEATSATGNSSHSAAAAAATTDSSSGTARPASAQSSLLAQLKKRETQTQGSVFSGLTVKRPAGVAASASPAFSSAASTSAGATAAAAAPRVATVEPLDLLSSAAGLGDMKCQQKQQQQQHTLLSPVSGEATAGKVERIFLNSAAAPHRNGAAAAVDMLSLDQAFSGNDSPLCTSAAAAASGAAAPARVVLAAGTSYFPSNTFTSQAPAFTFTTSTQQQQQLRSVDAASRTAHLDRFFGRFPAAAGAAAVPPHVSDVEQQQSTLVQTVQQQQTVIQKLQEQQQQMLLYLQEKQAQQRKGTSAADGFGVDAMHFPSPLHSTAASGGKAGVRGEGAAEVAEGAIQSSLLLSMTRSSSSLSSSTAKAARAAGGAGAHSNSGGTFEEAVAAAAAPATPRSSKFAFVKS